MEMTTILHEMTTRVWSFRAIFVRNYYLFVQIIEKLTFTNHIKTLPYD